MHTRLGISTDILCLWKYLTWYHTGVRYAFQQFDFQSDSLYSMIIILYDEPQHYHKAFPNMPCFSSCDSSVTNYARQPRSHIKKHYAIWRYFLYWLIWHSGEEQLHTIVSNFKRYSTERSKNDHGRTEATIRDPQSNILNLFLPTFWEINNFQTIQSRIILFRKERNRIISSRFQFWEINNL